MESEKIVWTKRGKKLKEMVRVKYLEVEEENKSNERKEKVKLNGVLLRERKLV